MGFLLNADSLEHGFSKFGLQLSLCGVPQHSEQFLGLLTLDMVVRVSRTC